VSLPEGVVKAAGWEEEQTTTNDRPETTSDRDDDGDEAGNEDEIEDGEAKKRQCQEKQAMLIKAAAANDRALEELEVQSNILRDALLKQAKLVSRDAQGLDKLASFVGAEDFAPLSLLVSGSQVGHNAAFEGFFKEAELKDAKKLSALFKEAQAIIREVIQKQEIQKRAHTVLGELKKEAFLGMAGNAIGRAVGTPVAAAVKAPFQGAARMAGNAAGSIGAAVSGKPFTPKPGGAISKAIGGAGAVGLGVGLDAAMYDPGVDKSTGHSNDVWANLQRE
jgi:hypothetical protein